MMRNVKVCCWLYLTHLHIGAGSDQLLVYLIWEAQARHSFTLPLCCHLRKLIKCTRSFSESRVASTSMFNWYYVLIDLAHRTESSPLALGT